MAENITATTAWDLIDALENLVPSSDNTSGATTATVMNIDDDGTVWVLLPGAETNTPVNGVTLAEVQPGDVVQVTIRDGQLSITGNATTPSIGQSQVDTSVEPIVNSINAVSIVTQQLQAEKANITELRATNATIQNLEADTAKVHDLTADQLTSTVGYIETLGANNISTSDLVADHATVNDLDTNYAKIDLANVGTGVVKTAMIDDAAIKTAKIDNGAITSALIRDGAVTNEKVLALSANKLTAGTIDASSINVTNLRADSLIVTKLNGQPVFGGYEAVNSNASGYSSMNPSAQGWYEISNGQMVQTSDTVVDMTKAYYTTSASVSLYDQSYIDSLETDLNNRIDGAIETFSGSDIPTLTNYPYTNWYDTTTNPVTDNRTEHIGDLYYVVNSESDSNGYCYRFYYDNTTHSYRWILIKDSDVTKALSDISDLQKFESNTTSWIDETDEGLETIRTNHTELSGRVDVTVKASVQLWFTKNGTDAPDRPSSQVISDSTSGNDWRTVVPAYDILYPNYFYCWQYLYSNDTYGWSAVIRDIAMEESQAQARTALSTANTNIMSSVVLWYTSNSTTPPSKPYTDGSSSYVTSTDSSSNGWRLVVPTYSSDTPYYHYCYQQQRGDGTYQWTTPTYDQATSDAMNTAKAALPAATFMTFEETTFKTVTDTVDEQKTTITQFGKTLEDNGISSTTNITNTVNSVRQTVSTNSSSISNLTSTLGTNPDGTTKDEDIVHRTSVIEQDLSGITTRVTDTEMHIAGTFATSSTESAVQDKIATIVPTISNWKLVTGVSITVKFTNENTHATPRLNVNATGAKTITDHNGNALTEIVSKWKAGAAYSFTYDGTNWRLQDSLLASRMSTAESTITQHASAIDAKVSKDGVIAAINLSTEQSDGSVAKISASKVEIDGTAIFNAISNDISAAITDGTTDLVLNTNAVTRTQRIYYRSSVSAKPTVMPTEWVTKSTNSWATIETSVSNWSLKVTPIANGNGASVTKYPYLWTCEQREMADGTLAYTTVLLDGSTTVIDGGSLIAGTVTANSINVSDLYALNAKIGGFTIDSTSLYTGSAVTSNANNAVAFASSDFKRTLLSKRRGKLRLAIGNKFGVDGEGNLFSSGANITGINAGNITGGKINASLLKASKISDSDGANSWDLRPGKGKLITTKMVAKDAKVTGNLYITTSSKSAITLATSKYPKAALSKKKPGKIAAIKYANASCIGLHIQNHWINFIAASSDTNLFNTSKRLTYGRICGGYMYDVTGTISPTYTSKNKAIKATFDTPCICIDGPLNIVSPIVKMNHKKTFSGVLHIHGILYKKNKKNCVGNVNLYFNNGLLYNVTGTSSLLTITKHTNQWDYSGLAALGI